mmetsp:Transcript_12122/g.26444  ORF Transcript_12122/g.26444 Transcript_12122/m.26444 type:complete len:136 (-) Transcript_12122:4588-4995(-)
MRQNQTQKLDRENRKSVMWRAIFGDMIEKDTSCVNFLEMQSRRKQTSYLSGITIINDAPHQCGSPLAPSAQRLLGRMRPSACDDGHVPGAWGKRMHGVASVAAMWWRQRAASRAMHAWSGMELLWQSARQNYDKS